jgi:hypothetical protein
MHLEFPVRMTCQCHMTDHAGDEDTSTVRWHTSLGYSTRLAIFLLLRQYSQHVRQRWSKLDTQTGRRPYQCPMRITVYFATSLSLLVYHMEHLPDKLKLQAFAHLGQKTLCALRITSKSLTDAAEEQLYQEPVIVLKPSGNLFESKVFTFYRSVMRKPRLAKLVKKLSVNQKLVSLGFMYATSSPIPQLITILCYSIGRKA